MNVSKHIYVVFFAVLSSNICHSRPLPRHKFLAKCQCSDDLHLITKIYNRSIRSPFGLKHKEENK